MGSHDTALSPQDRIAILEDLVEFYAGRNAQGAAHILALVADLEYASLPGVPRDDMRASVVHVGARLTRLAHELAIGNLNNEATLAALKRFPYIAGHPGLHS